MGSLTVLEWLAHQDGRRTAFVAAPFNMNRAKPEIVGQTVSLDGSPYRVIGCERYTSGKPTIDAGESIGLLVEKDNG
jgi:hypothetical protein